MTDLTAHRQTAVQSSVALSKAIDAIVVESGALAQLPTLVRNHFNAKFAFLVSDENTWDAAGRTLSGILSDGGIAVAEQVFPGTPRLKGKVENAETLIPQLKKNGGVPVAVGSGVINDLVKYAAFQVDTPYISVATAASMDGYASAGSPLTIKGFKHTIPCAPPRVMIADLDVVSRAPKEMASWGYGDLAGKISAGADWLVADALGVEAIDQTAWRLVQDDLLGWLADPQRLASGDEAATAALFTGLVAAGVAMEVHGSSRPASGADHQIAHLWEMDGLSHNGLPVSHGTCVALATLTILALYEWLLRQDLQAVDPEPIIRTRRGLPDLEDDVRRRFPAPEIADRAIREIRAKHPDDEELRSRIQRLRAVWPELRARLSGYVISFAKMKRMLEEAGVATDPNAVGIDSAYHRETVFGALLIRRRYTILDLLEETGRLEEAVGHVFSSSGPWR